MTEPRIRMAGNTVIWGGRATAWYRMAPQRWNFMSPAARHDLLAGSAGILAEFVGQRIYWRKSEVNLTANQWDARLAMHAPNALPAWSAHRRRTRDHLVATDRHKKICFVGVSVAKRTTIAGLLTGLWGYDTVEDIASVVARPGWDARPATGDEMEWLWRRSVQLGHPAPTTSGHGDVPWEPDDMAEITRSARMSEVPYGRTVKIVRDGVARYVVVAVVGRSASLESQDGPWLSVADRLGIPVEVAAVLDVQRPASTRKTVRDKILRARSQWRHFEEEHDQSAPRDLEDARDYALEVEQELSGGFTGINTRAHGWVKLAVAGDTEAEALRNYDRLASAHKPVTLERRGVSQYWAAREFWPGAPLRITSYRRVAPVKTFAGAVPHAAPAVGHQSGFYLGHTNQGGRHNVFIDLWRPMETRPGDPPNRLTRSGLIVIAGALGSGKSSLVAALAYQAAMMGVPSYILDPKGPLAKLCALPELAGRTRHIDMLNAEPGILNPRRLYPIPSRGTFAGTDAAYARAVEAANAEARKLTKDVLLGMLPANVRDQPDTSTVIIDAARQAVIAHPHDWSPGHVLDELAKMATEHTSWASQARVVASQLADLAALPAAQLIFEIGDPSLDFTATAGLAAGAPRPLLTVLTMEGLVLPREDADRRDLSTDEVMSLATLQLSTGMINRDVYGDGTASRKFAAVDEVHNLSRTGPGRLMLNTGARMSRSYDVAYVLASQNPADLMMAGIANLVGGVFGLRCEDPEVQAQLVEMMHLAKGIGFEEAFATLSGSSAGHREAIWFDGETGTVERVVLDESHFPAHVQQALDTNPGLDAAVHANGKVHA